MKKTKIKGFINAGKIYSLSKLTMNKQAKSQKILGFLLFTLFLLAMGFVLAVPSTSISCSPNPVTAGNEVNCTTSPVNSLIPVDVVWYDSLNDLQFSDNYNKNGAALSTHTPATAGTWTIYIKNSTGYVHASTTLTVNSAQTCGNGIVEGTEVCDDNNNNDADGCSSTCLTESLFYADSDGDNYGNAANSIYALIQPAGYVTDNTDCDDSNPAINPSATEVCDGVDNNCDGSVDDSSSADALTWYLDSDTDTFGDSFVTILACSQPLGYVDNSADCDDKVASCNSDCSSLLYNDADSDGYGNAADFARSCDAAPSYTSDTTDCDDADNLINPSATEVCDGVDNNCDTNIDEGLGTLPADNINGLCSSNVKECSGGNWIDSSSNYAPSLETCDNLDNDCNGAVDEGLTQAASNVLGECSGNTQSCSAGNWYDDLTNYIPSTDIWNNEKDDDCDGVSLMDSDAPTTANDAPTTWIKDSVTVSLSCNDESGSGCDKTYYKLDGSFCLSSDGGCSFTEGNTISIDSEGIHTLQYYSTDLAGNSETTKTIYVYVDKTAPTTTATGSVDGICTDSTTSRCSSEYVFDTWSANPVNVELACDDGSLSGCDKLNYLVNGEDTNRYEPARSIPTIKKSLSFSQPGYYTITYYSVDIAGNIENTNSVVVKILAPGPIGGNFEFNNDESPENASNVTLNSDWTLTMTTGNGTSSVFLPAGTVISGITGNLNLSAFSSEGDSIVSGFESWRIVEGAIQFGIPNFGLSFSNPITIKIFVGNELNGTTLNIMRATSSASGWETSGLSSTTCLVDAGICEFNTTKASYFTTTSGSAPASTPVASPSGGSSSGSCLTTWTCSAWSACTNGEQTRTCSPVNNACYADPKLKPATTQTCNSQTQPATTETTATGRPAGITGAIIGAFSTPRNAAISSLIIILVLLALIMAIMKRRKNKATKAKKGKKAEED
jgi:cysteine-rich repeat protein